MDYATTLMYADDANNLTFTACSFPKLQHDMNVADSKLADGKQADFKNGILMLCGLRQRTVTLNTRERARYLYKQNFATTSSQQVMFLTSSL